MSDREEFGRFVNAAERKDAAALTRIIQECPELHSQEGDEGSLLDILRNSFPEFIEHAFAAGLHPDSALPFQVSRIPQQPLGFNFGMVAIPVPGRIDRFSVRFDRAVRDGWTLKKNSGPLKGSIYFPGLRSESFFSEQLSAQVSLQNPLQVSKLDSTEQGREKGSEEKVRDARN